MPNGLYDQIRSKGVPFDTSVLKISTPTPASINSKKLSIVKCGFL